MSKSRRKRLSERQKELEQKQSNPIIYVGAVVVLVLIIAVVIIVVNKAQSGSSTAASNPTAVPTIATSNTANTAPANVTPGQMVTTADGLQYQDLVVGTGAEAVAGKSVTVNYVGTLTNGTKFDSSYDRNQPFSFTLGNGEVIKGWDEGVAGMKVGGKRHLIIPSTLGYGDQGAPPTIPGGATLIFDVELLSVQ